MKPFKYGIFLIFTALLTLVFQSGCGGGGGGKSDISGIVANLIPGRLTYENGGEENILFASVKGNGISDGWIENQTGVKTGGNLSYNRPANAYEITLSNARTALPAGTWTLKYWVGSEQFELKKTNVSWTTLPGFTNSSTPAWNASSKLLSLNIPSVNGSNPSFYFRLYHAATGSIADESLPVSGGLLTMQVNFPDDYIVMLVADFKENDQVVSTARHIYPVTSLN